MIGNSNNETKFSHKLLLTNRQVANLRKNFGSYLSTDIKLSTDTIRTISWQNYWSIIINSNTINKKYNSTTE